MEPIVYQIRLDVTKPGSQETIYMKRGDTKTRKVVVFLANQTKPYAIPEGAGAILCAIKPDGTIVFNTVSVGDNGTVFVTVTSGTLAVPGRVQCEMRILGIDGEVLTSPGFDICVEDVLDVDSALESTDEYTALTEALLEIESIAADEAERVQAESDRATAESLRTGAETARASAESARISNESARTTAETARLGAESARISAESDRDTAEGLREQAKAATIAATGAANSAATAANTAAGNADVATGAANTAAGAANLAAGAANSAAGAANLAANAANTAAQKAESAAPHIGANGHWYAWNGTTHVDTNVVAEGRGIASVTLHSGNHAPGTTDTYRITFTDATYYDYTVYNGMDGEGAGDMLKAVYDPTEKNADAFSMGSMAETPTAKVMTDTERTKLAGIETGANKYVHPASHPPSIITQDENNRFVTDAEKASWSNKLSAETDPTVPSWAKQPSKPTYTAADVGAAATSHSHAQSDITGLSTTLAGKAAVSVAYTATLTAASWTGTGPYTQTVTVTGLPAGAKGVVGLADSATAAQREAARDAMLVKTAQDAGSVTITADGDKPTINIPIVITEVG